MGDPFDKSRCSFVVPEFSSEEEEERWAQSLTPEQRLELLRLMQLWRWGEEALNRPIDRSSFQLMSTEEFVRLKEEEDAAEDQWRIAHGLRARLSDVAKPNI